MWGILRVVKYMADAYWHAQGTDLFTATYNFWFN